MLELRRLELRIIRAELAHKTAPSLKPIVAIHQADDLGSLAKALRQGADVTVGGASSTPAE